MNNLRNLLYQLNHTDIPVKLSTFSKANKIRDPQMMWHLYHKLLRYTGLYWAVSSRKEAGFMSF